MGELSFNKPSFEGKERQRREHTSFRSLVILGFDFYDPIPHFSTFGKNYERRFKNSNLFEQIFSHILSQAIEHGLVNTEYMYAASTHVKAKIVRKK